MEKNLKTKINEHNNNFKSNLTNWIKENGAKLYVGDVDKTNEFVQYLLDFPNIELAEDDFKKRKRLKNDVPDYDRCIALKCNGERCSRKQKNENSKFCGTHIKGYPHGTVNNSELIKKKKQVDLWVEEINGISKYIDNDSNVYSTEDIRNLVNPPRIVAKYGIENGNYYIIKTS